MKSLGLSVLTLLFAVCACSTTASYACGAADDLVFIDEDGKKILGGGSAPLKLSHQDKTEMLAYNKFRVGYSDTLDFSKYNTSGKISSCLCGKPGEGVDIKYKDHAFTLSNLTHEQAHCMDGIFRFYERRNNS